ncbi:MAG TPA: sensor histidine kinase, partial [Candidatus Methylomirabilis sp.]|nr:sensor histidine kinase [Candidatus Methylomirabilis sp.]
MRTEGAQQKRWLRLLGLGAAILLVTIGHILTPLDRQAQHDILVRLYYIPIALGGLWYGLWGGLGTAALITLVYLPHVIRVDHGVLTIGYLLEVPIFVAVGFLIGL